MVRNTLPLLDISKFSHWNSRMRNEIKIINLYRFSSRCLRVCGVGRGWKSKSRNAEKMKNNLFWKFCEGDSAHPPRQPTSSCWCCCFSLLFSSIVLRCRCRRRAKYPWKNFTPKRARVEILMKFSYNLSWANSRQCANGENWEGSWDYPENFYINLK